MCTSPIHIRQKASAWDLYRGLSSDRDIIVPCGKCSECLSKRQNDLSIRVCREAHDKGSAVFVTLTYQPKCVPFAKSIWCVDKETGEEYRFSNPELVTSKRELGELRKEFFDYGRSKFAKTGFVKDVPLVSDLYSSFVDESLVDRFEFFMRFVPTCDYSDVQKAIKRWRKNNPDLPKFTYCFVSEYGTNPYKSRRPHYHALFFGLKQEDCQGLLDTWHFGSRKEAKQVNFFNVDGSNGIEKVSKYLGKYACKGKFDVVPKQLRCTLRDRLCTSKGLALSDFETLKKWHLGLDLFDYDPENAHKLDKSYLDKIVDTIISRLYWPSNFKLPYALPNSFIRYIFNCRKLQEKTVYSTIYYLVKDVIRSRVLQTRKEEFEKFVFVYGAENLSAAVTAFNLYQSRCMQAREEVKKQNILNFYRTHSKI